MASRNYISPIHYQDEGNNCQDIDLNIQAQSDEEEFSYNKKENLFNPLRARVLHHNKIQLLIPLMDQMLRQFLFEY